MDGYDTFDHVPVTKCLDYIYGLAGIFPNKRLTRSRDIDEGRWETQYGDNGYMVYYFCSHFQHLTEKCIKAWNSGRYLVINIGVKHWPAIPPVIMDIGRKVEALYGPSFSKEYFMGIANISKMESEVPRETSLYESHNQYHENRVAAHTDSPREGEVIITLQLTESIIFHLNNL